MARFLITPRHKTAQADGRASIRPKRSVTKRDGPLPYVADLLMKRLRREGFPALYRLSAVYVDPPSATFWNELGDTPEFGQAFSDLSGIVARSCRVPISLDGLSFSLVGEWALVPRYGKRHTKPVAVTLKPITSG